MTLISDGGGLGLINAVMIALMLAPVIFAAVFLRRRADRQRTESSILGLDPGGDERRRSLRIADLVERPCLQGV